MNRAFFRCLAASRTRSSPGDTLARLGVRCVRRPPVFPSVLPLGSTDSASGRPDLFAGCSATMERSDFSCSCIIGYGSSPPRCGPPGDAVWSNQEISRFPCTEPRIHARVSDHAGSARHSLCAPGRVAFRWVNGVGTLNCHPFAAQWLACVLPCPRFAPHLTVRHA